MTSDGQRRTYEKLKSRFKVNMARMFANKTINARLDFPFSRIDNYLFIESEFRQSHPLMLGQSEDRLLVGSAGRGRASAHLQSRHPAEDAGAGAGRHPVKKEELIFFSYERCVYLLRPPTLVEVLSTRATERVPPASPRLLSKGTAEDLRHPP